MKGKLAEFLRRVIAALLVCFVLQNLPGYSQEVYRLLNTEPVFDTVDFRTSKDRLLFRILSGVCADSAGNRRENVWRSAYIGTKHYLKPSDALYEKISGMYRQLKTGRVHNPLISIFDDLIPINEYRALLTADQTKPELEFYRTQATILYPYSTAPNFQTSGDFYFGFNSDNCLIKVFNDSRHFLDNPGSDILIESGDLIEAATDIADTAGYQRIGRITDDNLITLDLGTAAAAEPGFLPAMTYALHDLSVEINRRLEPANDFVPPYLYKRTKPRLAAQRARNMAERIWEKDQLFKTFAYMRIAVPDYPGFYLISRAVSQRLYDVLQIIPEIIPVSVRRMVRMSPDEYDLRLNMINFDTHELVDIWKQIEPSTNKTSKSEPSKKSARSTEIAPPELRHLIMTQKTEAEINRLYKGHIPLFWQVYPLYRVNS